MTSRLTRWYLRPSTGRKTPCGQRASAVRRGIAEWTPNAPRLVGRRADDSARRRRPAADDHRLAAQLRPVALLDRREERIEVDVEDRRLGHHRRPDPCRSGDVVALDEVGQEERQEHRRSDGPAEPQPAPALRTRARTTKTGKTTAGSAPSRSAASAGSGWRGATIWGMRRASTRAAPGGSRAAATKRTGAASTRFSAWSGSWWSIAQRHDGLEDLPWRVEVRAAPRLLGVERRLAGHERRSRRGTRRSRPPGRAPRASGASERADRRADPSGPSPALASTDRLPAERQDEEDALDPGQRGEQSRDGGQDPQPSPGGQDRPDGAGQEERLGERREEEERGREDRDRDDRRERGLVVEVDRDEPFEAGHRRDVADPGDDEPAEGHRSGEQPPGEPGQEPGRAARS